ncbi:MAG: AAA family ATPase [Syntrophobacteraceae bacterium]|nr:AAA family ATPase [Syntrophobacteraceae bacterium]
MSALKQLKIDHLRGSVVPFSLAFEKGKKLTVVYGENGAGKSTICDAFDFLGKGTVGSLENRGLGKTSRFWCSLGKKSSDVAVQLETLSSSCRAVIQRSNVVVTPPENRPGVEVLRRKQILALIEATPSNRYESIRRFIDVSGIEASEETLKGLIRDLNRGRDIAAARVQENIDELRRTWETAGSPGKAPFSWATAEAARDAKTLETEISNLVALQDAYKRMTAHPDQLISAEESLKDAQNFDAAAINSVEECAKDVAKDARETVGLLEAAQDYLAKNPSPFVCPLCESREKAADLARRVEERLSKFSSLQAALKLKTAAEESIRTAISKIEACRASFETDVLGFEKWRSENIWPKDISLPDTPAPQSALELKAWLSKNDELAKTWKVAETERYDKKQTITNLAKGLENWRSNSETLEALDRLIPRLTKALELLGEERRKFTDSVLTNIANEVGRLYEAVHPGEGLDKISLQLDPNKRASLEIEANFCGQCAPPQAYFSDSHLDTLGLCVFLALAALDQPENTILVLDDVLASVDEPHVDRLIEMLYSEALRFRHCIITTHYGPWKHKLRWGWLKSGECQFVELAKWTNLSGLAVIRTIPDVERLRTLLAETPPDLQLVSSKAGYILEAALNFLTLLYECAVPRKHEDRYTIGDLLPVMSKKLREAMRVDVLTGKDETGAPQRKTVILTPILNELIRIAEARNLFGCHFKVISFEHLDREALAFGRKVLELMETLTDPDAGWPKNDKSGEYWATSGETRRLYPLRKPS